MISNKNQKKLLLKLLLGSLLCFIFIYIFKTSDFWAVSIGTAHAESLHNQLTPGADPNTLWVFSVWRTALGVANGIVVIVLLFFAVINILHINYDTYQIKKTLPLLIIGIVMANFSIVISRMIVDAASVLTLTFARDTVRLSSNLLCAFGIGSAGAVGVAGAVGLVSILLGMPQLIGGLLILIILLVLAVVIGFAILAFLLWIRKTIILLLVAAAPVAFVLMAFPPTQSVFKRWWDWFIKWVFMGPIIWFLIWVAGQIGQNNCITGRFTIGTMLSALGIIYLAAIVPFKLGGAVMSGWAGLGKYISGTGKGGYLRKPTEEFVDRKKGLVKDSLKDRWYNTKWGQTMLLGRKADESIAQVFKNRQDRRQADAETEIRQRPPGFLNRWFRRTGSTYGEQLSESEAELERAKNRAESRKKKDFTEAWGKQGEDAGREEIELANAEEKTKTVKAESRRQARERMGAAQAKFEIDQKTQQGEEERVKYKMEKEAREQMGVKQDIIEAEQEFAKQEVEVDKMRRLADIKEGFADLSDTEIQSIMSTRTTDPIRTTMDIKRRYMEQNNRMTMQKERIAKREGQDLQIVCERDMRANMELRTVMRFLNEAGAGITTTLDDNGTDAGITRSIDYAKALEIAERLRYQASTAPEAERITLTGRADTLVTEAGSYKNRFQTYNDVAITLDRHAATLRAAGQMDKATEIQAEADTARAKSANAIIYEAYLTNNLFGRRMKITNPDIKDEAHTQVISTPPLNLISDAGVIIKPDGTVEVDKNKVFGTGDARANTDNMFDFLNGNQYKLNESQVRACTVQAHAIHEVMEKARHGDTIGLSEIEAFMTMMEAAGRDDFKGGVKMIALSSLGEANQQTMKEELARRALGISTVDWETRDTAIKNKAAWDRLTNDQRRDLGIKTDKWDERDISINQAAWDRLTLTQQRDAIANLNFSTLEAKGSSDLAIAQRNFIDAASDVIESDEAIGFSLSPGAVLSRVRPINEGGRVENANIDLSKIFTGKI